MVIKSIILLDGNRTTFQPGETITGHINYTFNSPKKIKGIIIKFKGIAETQWTTTHSSGRSSRTTQHKALECYFAAMNHLLGGTGTEVELPPNNYSYYFSFTLPPSIPSSFEGIFGHIRYTIRIILQRPWKFDHETELMFKIFNNLDLNIIPNIKEPVRMRLVKTFMCFSGMINIGIYCPLRGFCPGEIAPVEINVENGSNHNVCRIELQLKKIETFHCYTPKPNTRIKKNILVAMHTQQIRKNSNGNYKLLLKIPPLVPSQFINCSIIQLNYIIKVICVMGMFLKNVEVYFPVTIGNIPLNAPSSNATNIILNQNFHHQLSADIPPPYNSIEQRN